MNFVMPRHVLTEASSWAHRKRTRIDNRRSTSACMTHYCAVCRNAPSRCYASVGKGMTSAAPRS